MIEDLMFLAGIYKYDWEKYLSLTAINIVKPDASIVYFLAHLFMVNFIPIYSGQNQQEFTMQQ